jgi:hypothetical protein
MPFGCWLLLLLPDLANMIIYGHGHHGTVIVLSSALSVDDQVLIVERNLMMN